MRQWDTDTPSQCYIRIIKSYATSLEIGIISLFFILYNSSSRYLG